MLDTPRQFVRVAQSPLVFLELLLIVRACSRGWRRGAPAPAGGAPRSGQPFAQAVIFLDRLVVALGLVDPFQLGVLIRALSVVELRVCVLPLGHRFEER